MANAGLSETPTKNGIVLVVTVTGRRLRPNPYHCFLCNCSWLVLGVLFQVEGNIHSNLFSRYLGKTAQSPGLKVEHFSELYKHQIHQGAVRV